MLFHLDWMRVLVVFVYMSCLVVLYDMSYMLEYTCTGLPRVCAAWCIPTMWPTDHRAYQVIYFKCRISEGFRAPSVVTALKPHDKQPRTQVWELVDNGWGVRREMTATWVRDLLDLLAAVSIT